VNVLLIDNGDSFTYNIYSLVCKLGYSCRVLPIEDFEAYKENFSWDTAILGPGPGSPRDRPELIKFIHNYCYKKPILGICLGHQAIGYYFGSEIVNAMSPFHGKVSKLEFTPPFGVLLKRLKLQTNFETEKRYVTRYHSLILDKVPRKFEILAFSSDDLSIQIMKHLKLPLWGIQFHPESILTLKGDDYLNMFFASSKI